MADSSTSDLQSMLDQWRSQDWKVGRAQVAN